MIENEVLRKFTLCLSREKGVGSKRYLEMINIAGDIETLYKGFELDVAKLDRLLGNARKLEDPILTSLERIKEVDYKCIWEDDFPELLKQISDPPIVIFYRGTWDTKIFNNCISIVGSRKLSTYGKKWARRFASNLGAKGFTIVSGMALGIDREAHTGALSNDSKTIAVLAAAVQEPSPSSNTDIYRKILDKNGLIISEYGPDIKINPGLFPQRNRIIAGLSKGTIIIEAGKKSGALITGSLALDYNREVFALPGNIDSLSSEGCNSLIRRGEAKLIQSVEDVLVEFGHQGVSNESKNKDSILKGLSKEERVIYDVLLTEPKISEDISKMTNLSISKVVSICSVLEIKSILIKNERGQWCLN